MSNRPLLVLDLDETLWHGKITSNGVNFLLRPHLGEFLRLIAENYDLAVWTSATQDWMLAGLKVVTQETGFDLERRAVFLWHRSRATLRRTEDGEYDWRKPARKFRAKWLRERYPRQRILVIDDRPENYACGYGHLVSVRAWTGDSNDTQLPALGHYLASIATESDLTKLEKRGWLQRVLAPD